MRGDGAERHQLSARAGNVYVFELVRIEPVHALDLRDDLVGAAGDVEAVHEIAAHHGRHVGADLLQVKPEFGRLVAVDDDFRLRLVDFDIDDRRESEHGRSASP